MKTIEVSDKMYDALIELATNMTTQDPRGTAMPHLFQIRERKKIYHWGLEGEHTIWIDSDNEREVETFDEFWDYLIDYVLMPDLGDEELEAEKQRVRLIWDSESFDIEDFIDEHCPELKKCSYSWDYVYHNAFLTEKACKEHISRNDYHYNNPIDYLNHAWRNPEMELISDFLCSLVGKPIHK